MLMVPASLKPALQDLATVTPPEAATQNWVLRTVQVGQLSWVIALHVESKLPLILPSFDILQVSPIMVFEQGIAGLFNRAEIDFTKRLKFLRDFEHQGLQVANMTADFNVERVLQFYRTQMIDQPIVGIADLEEEAGLLERLVSASIELGKLWRDPQTNQTAWQAFRASFKAVEADDDINRMLAAMVKKVQAEAMSARNSEIATDDLDHYMKQILWMLHVLMDDPKSGAQQLRDFSLNLDAEARTTIQKELRELKTVYEEPNLDD